MPPRSVGGPVFLEDGDLVGITSLAGDDEAPGGDARIVAIDAVCASLALAEPAMKDAAPSGRHLPWRRRLRLWESQPAEAGVFGSTR